MDGNIAQFPTILRRLKVAKIRHDNNRRKEREDKQLFYLTKNVARVAANPDITLEVVCIKHNVKYVNRYDVLTGLRFDCCPVCERQYFDNFIMGVVFDEE